jgi:hypothetical protein
MIGVISGSCLQQGRRDFAVAVRDQDEPGAVPDLGGRVDGQTRPIVPVTPPSNTTATRAGRNVIRAFK